MAAQKSQPLMAELEKLEQQITLTMQEIDANFAKAHMLVTSHIIPIAERYGKGSAKVWEGSKFWKQFFEASANVALSNYQEETANCDTATGIVLEQPGHNEDCTSTFHENPVPLPESQPRMQLQTAQVDMTSAVALGGSIGDTDVLNDSLLSSPGLSRPKVGQTTLSRTITESPFEKWQRQWNEGRNGSETPEMQPPVTRNNLELDYDNDSSVPVPSTPKMRKQRPVEFKTYETPGNHGYREARAYSAARTPGLREDPLLHRTLDKTWRLQATPMGKPAASRYRTIVTPEAQLLSAPRMLEDGSSPIAPEPELHTIVFTPHGFRSLKTPRRSSMVSGDEAKKESTQGCKLTMAMKDEYIYDDSDSDILLPSGFSPPKTMQFSLPPSALLATPAKEASKRIVHDILQTAGASLDDESGVSRDGSSVDSPGMDPF